LDIERLMLLKIHEKVMKNGNLNNKENVYKSLELIVSRTFDEGQIDRTELKDLIYELGSFID
jgi:hypothetical protein